MASFDIRKVALSVLGTLVLSTTCVLAAIGPAAADRAVAVTTVA